MVEVTGISDKLVGVMFEVYSFPQIILFIRGSQLLYYFAVYKTHIGKHFLV